MNADPRRYWLAAGLVAFALAAQAEEPSEVVQRAAAALAKGDVAAFSAVFGPKMPGLAKIRSDLSELVRQSDVQSTIRFGDNGTADWELRIAEKQGSHAITHRQAKVTYRVEGSRIEAFSPGDFFRLPRVDGAWNVLESAATALSNGNATEFLSYFQKSMPAYEKLQAGVVALIGQGEVHSFIDMQSNEGTDTSRTIDVDWTLALVNADTSIRHAARDERVKCRLELDGKRWKITAVEPAGFFSAILLGTNFPHQGKRRGALLDGQLERNGGVRRNTVHGRADGA